LYTTGGDFVVTLTASNGDCNDVFTFNVNNVSIEENQLDLIHLFPNPASNVLNIQTPAQTHLIITDMMGKQVMNIVTNQTVTTIDISTFASGLYVVQGYNSNGRFTAKFEKQ
jgi:hypothetical protein